eukprot:gene11401-12741_t
MYGLNGDTNRRTTLGPLNSSAINTRNTRRVSVEPTSKFPPRPSLSGSGGGGGGGRRSSLTTTTAAMAGQGPGGPNGPGMARASSLSSSAGGSSSSRVSDPRPITDKSFLNMSIRLLLDFLNQHGYEHVVNAKILSKPTNKDYYQIVLFLFHLIDPNYVCTGKIEEEIVAMFRFLGYPFAINKSNISAVGSPHAWPQMLASIMWLVELLSYDDAVQQAGSGPAGSSRSNGNGNGNGGVGVQEEEEGGEEGSRLEKDFYSYLHRSYTYFISGKDAQYRTVEEQFLEGWKHQNEVIQDRVDSLSQKNIAIEAEIQAIKQRSLALPQLNGRKSDLTRQLNHLKDSVANKVREVEEVRQRISAKQSDRDALSATITAVKREVHKVKDILSKQELSAEDVVNMTNERERLEKTFSQLSETRLALNQEIYRLELSLRDRLSYLESSVRSYHAIAEDLKLVPLGNKNARGEDYSISLDIKAKRRDQLLLTDVKNHLLVLLNEVRKELQEMTLELRQEVLEEQERVEEAEGQRAQLVDLSSSQTEKLSFLDQIWSKEKANFDAISALHQKEIFDLEHKLIALRDLAAEEARLTSLTRKIAELTSLKTHYSMEFESKKAMMVEEVLQVVSLCAAHREEVQNTVDALKTSYAQRLQKLLSKESLYNLMLQHNKVMADMPGVPMLAAPFLPPPPPPAATTATAAKASESGMDSSSLLLEEEDFLFQHRGAQRDIAMPMIGRSRGGGVSAGGAGGSSRWHSEAEEDSVRFDDDQEGLLLLDGRDLSLLSEADQGNLHALMHGLEPEAVV